jgi:oxygen-independent coproporphyrinogen-3 oxidase
VTAGGLAVARGIELDDDDRLRAWVIERLMCDFAVPVNEMLTRFGHEADAVLQEMRYSALCDGDDLVRFDGETYAVTDRGRPFVRSIASTFDTYLAGGAGRHSVAV